ITSTSFDSSKGSFTGATGTSVTYLGDLIGLAAANGTAYAAWTGTDTRSGNQDIYFDRYSLTPAPAPLGDRFEPNNNTTTPTNLGQVLGRRVLAGLVVGAGDQDWFRVQAGATGDLTVTATATVAGDKLQLELWSQDGTTVLNSGSAFSDSSGQVIGEQVIRSSVPSQTYLIRVTGDSAVRTTYSLEVRSLTADLGTQVSGSLTGTLPAGGKMEYQVALGVAGSLQATLTPEHVTGTLNLQALNAATLAVLGSLGSG